MLNAARMKAKLRAGNRPYVTLKAAISLDGRIATRTGASRWITGPAARDYAHHLRAIHDAVLVGVGTVLTDDPRLSVRLPGVKATPARVVLDSRCRLPAGANCLDGDGARRFVVTGAAAPPAKLEALRNAGAEVIVCHSERPAPSEFLPALREQGISTLLVEGGAEVHANLIANREPDELFLFVAGIVIGGGGAPGWCASLGVESLDKAPRLRLDPPYQVGGDVVLHGSFDRE